MMINLNMYVTTTWALRAAVYLWIERGGQIAREANWEPDGGRRVMRALGEMGMVVKWQR